MIADEFGCTAQTLGMIHEARFKHCFVVFIVDDQGILRLIMYYPQEQDVALINHATRTSSVDLEEVAIPENRPNNEFIEIMYYSTENNVDLADERKKLVDSDEVEYLDWWFTMLNSK